MTMANVMKHSRRIILLSASCILNACDFDDHSDSKSQVHGEVISKVSALQNQKTHKSVVFNPPIKLADISQWNLRQGEMMSMISEIESGDRARIEVALNWMFADGNQSGMTRELAERYAFFSSCALLAWESRDLEIVRMTLRFLDALSKTETHVGIKGRLCLATSLRSTKDATGLHDPSDLWSTSQPTAEIWWHESKFRKKLESTLSGGVVE
jgi:hypothetical protein